MPRLNTLKLVSMIAVILLISTAHAVMAASNVYTIQVSAHRTAAEAAARVSDLAAQGVEAFTSEERVAGRGLWYRVYVGRYANRAEALTHARDLRNHHLISDFWVKTTKHLPMESTPPAAYEPEAPAFHEAPMTVVLENESGHLVPVETETPLGEAIDPSDDSLFTDAPVSDLDIGYKMESEANDLTGGGTAKAGTGEPAPEVVRFGRPREASLGGFSPDGPNEYVRGPFYIGMRAGMEQWLHASDFRIAQTRWLHTTYYKTDSERAGFIGFTPGYRLTPNFTVEGMVERTWAGDIYGWTGGLGLKFGTTLPNNIYTYGKINGLLGSIHWDDVPGNFKNDVGYELACGVDVNLNRFKLGFELGYRALEFEYEAPNDGSTYSGDSELDLSSVRFSTSLSYAF